MAPGRFLICDCVSDRFIEVQRNAKQRNAKRRPLLPGSDSFKNKGTLCLPYSVLKKMKFHKGCLLSISY